MDMGRDKGIGGSKKCRKFTGLVDFHKTIAVVSSALSRACTPFVRKQHKDQRDFYQVYPLRRAMIRPHFVALAAGAVLALTAGTAEAARAKRTSRAPVTHPVTHASGSSAWHGQSGQASYYGKAHHGKRTASGARFDQNAMTAAHPWLPFGTKVRVTRRDTGHSIVVVINDRLPSKRHIIDLSLGAARQLGMVREGTTQVDLEPAEAPSG